MVMGLHDDPDDQLVHIWVADRGMADVLHGLMTMVGLVVVPDAPQYEPAGRWSFAFGPKDDDTGTFQRVLTLLVIGASNGTYRPF